MPVPIVIAPIVLQPPISIPVEPIPIVAETPTTPPSAPIPTPIPTPSPPLVEVEDTEPEAPVGKRARTNSAPPPPGTIQKNAVYFVIIHTI
jgi:hypothetical protein